MAKRSFIKVIYMSPFSVCKYIINPKISVFNPKPLFGRYMARKIVQNSKKTFYRNSIVQKSVRYDRTEKSCNAERHCSWLLFFPKRNYRLSTFSGNRS